MQKPLIDREALLAQVWAIAEPLCEYEGIELVHVEFQRESRGRVLRLYIDRPEGVTLDDCTQISRQASDLLDIELDYLGPHSLEVSSPGIDRPISREADFIRFSGDEAKIKTAKPIGGQKNFKGILAGISEGIVKLQINDKQIGIPLADIRSARLIGILGKPPFD